jgi:flagellar motor switch protein FliM
VAADNAILSQREIDALLSGADSSRAEAEQLEGAPRSIRRESRRIKPYDFRHPEKLSKEQLRGLQIIQQSVAGSMAASFSGRLRTPVEARLSALERGIYEEYVAQIGVSAIVVVIDMSPLQGYAMAAFSIDLALSMIDRLLGGSGRSRNRHAPQNRDLTDIELALVRHVGFDIARSLIDPWARVTELAPDVTDLAVGPQVMHIVPAAEFVITAWYELRFAEQTGGISLCFPLNVLEQVLPRLTGQSIFENRPGRRVRDDVKVQQAQVLPMTVPVQALLGSARVGARELLELQPGDIIVLDHEARDSLRIFVGNCERFAGFAGTRGRRIALQVKSRVDDDGWLQPFEEAV